MTGVYSTDEPKYAYGGGNEGAMGDVMRNAVTIDLAHVADLVEEAYGGMASVEDNTGAVDHNTANMKNGTTRLLYGGYTFGKGAVTNNEVHFEGGASTGYVMGGYLDNTASTAEMTGNKVVFTNGTAAEIVGADSKGEGKLSGNTATFGSAGSVAEILRGALAENEAAVEGNAVTMTGGSAERVYGGTTYATDPATGDLVAGTGNALNNTVTIEDGAVTKEIMGGIGYHADGNVVTIAGGTLDTYAKYFYTHQSGGSERLTTGEIYDFDDVDSSRLRIGTRWTKKTLAGEFYTGLAYEYEFGSDARASYAGYGTPTPTLKGSTGLFELGYRFVRPDSNVSYGVNLTGMMGKCRGITGSMQVNWAL